MTLNRKALAATAIGIPVTVLLVWLLPHAAANFPKMGNLSQTYILERRVYFYDPFPNASMSPRLEAKIEVEFHRAMKKSDTKTLKAWLHLERQLPNPTLNPSPQSATKARRERGKPTPSTVPLPTEYVPPTKAKLDTNDFKITTPLVNETKRSEQYEWSWLISTEAAGSRALILSFEPEVLLIPDETADLSIINNGSAILIPITVLTDLGLTSSQDAWFKAIGSLLGVVGTVAGYTFLKRYLEKSAT